MARRRTWAQRTGANTKAAAVLARAFNEKPIFETRDGEEWRVWPANVQSYSNDDIVKAIARQRAIEASELSHELPPTAVKYAVTKGWLVRQGTLLMVTEKAAAELKLPKRGPMGQIKFARAA
jgi:hypothetical protein